jgi:hypothetical protein
MQEIKLTFTEIAHFMVKILPFVPSDCENIDEIVEKALSLKEIPEKEILCVKSMSGNLDDAISEYWGTIEGDDEEKAAIRQSIRWATNEEELCRVYDKIMGGVTIESFEFMQFLRKAAIIEFKIAA